MKPKLTQFFQTPLD